MSFNRMDKQMTDNTSKKQVSGNTQQVSDSTQESSDNTQKVADSTQQEICTREACTQEAVDKTSAVVNDTANYVPCIVHGTTNHVN